MTSHLQQIELEAALQADELKKQKFNSPNEDQETDLEFDNKETRDTQNLNSTDKEVPTDSELFKKDFANIVLLNVLYFYQGLLIAFFLEYVKNYLIQEKKIQGEQIAMLRGILWPFSIKFLWAPLMDTYYIKQLGRRKTYVVPAQIFIAFVLFISAFYFESWIENVKVVNISTVGFLCIFLVTIQDIAVDSWSVVLLHERNVAYASFSQSFGQRMGNIFGYQLFIYLSDESLMDSIFGYDGKVLTPFSMCMMMSMAVFAGTFFIIFFRKEHDHYVDPSISENTDYQLQNTSEGVNETLAVQQEQDQQPQQEGFLNMIKSIALFFKNKSILLLILFLMTTSFGTFCVDVPGEIILLNKGFSRSTLATIELCLIPLTQIVSAVAAKLAQKKLEFNIWKVCIIIKTFWNIGNYIVISSFEAGKTSSYIIPIAILSIGDTVLSTLPFIALSAFFLRNCDQSIGGTYITFLNSFSNFGRLWPSLVITSISTHISFTTMFILGSTYNVLLILFWRNRSVQMQQSDKSNWLIKQQ